MSVSMVSDVIGIINNLTESASKDVLIQMFNKQEKEPRFIELPYSKNVIDLNQVISVSIWRNGYHQKGLRFDLKDGRTFCANSVNDEYERDSELRYVKNLLIGGY